MSTIDERWNIVDTTRAFCQKVLPLVYDESLSYMELVCKLSSKLNEVIENNNNLPLYIKGLIKETVNSDEFTQIVGSVLMDTIINVKFPPEGITPAKGDGVTDDTNSIQACLDYANSQGGAVVFFPSGKYLTGTLSINTETSILGADRYNTSLVRKGGGNTPLLQGVINQSVRNISLDGNRLNQVEENYLLDGTIDQALFDNVIMCDSAHCITADACNNSEFCNVLCKDIGDGVFITTTGNNNLLTNINTQYAINITGNNNNWQSQQQTKVGSVEPLIYQHPQKLNEFFDYITMQNNGSIYNVLVEGDKLENLSGFLFSEAFGISSSNDDNSQNFINFINAMHETGKIGILRKGTYNIKQQIITSGKNFKMIGETQTETIIIQDSTLTASPVQLANGTFLQLENFTVRGNGVNTGTLLNIQNYNNATVKNVCVENSSGNGMYMISGVASIECSNLIFDSCIARNCGASGIQLQGCEKSSIVNCYAENCQETGIYFKVPIKDCSHINNKAKNCKVAFSVGSSFPSYFGENILFANGICENCDTGIRIGETKNSLFADMILFLSNNGAAGLGDGIRCEAGGYNNTFKNIVLDGVASGRAAFRNIKTHDNYCEISKITNCNGNICSYDADSYNNVCLSNGNYINLSNNGENNFFSTLYPFIQNITTNVGSTLAINNMATSQVTFNASNTISTIEGGYSGRVILLRPNNNNVTLTLNEGGNIKMDKTKGPAVLNRQVDNIVFMYNQYASKWVELFRTDND